MQHVAPTPAARNPAEETGQLPALFDAGEEVSGPRKRRGPDYLAIQRSPEFSELRRRFRGFAFPMTAVFIVWYLVYVLLAAYAPGFMSVRVIGSVNIAILMGVAQFGSTAVITFAYLRYARRRIDPQVAQVRRQAGVS